MAKSKLGAGKPFKVANPIYKKAGAGAAKKAKNKTKPVKTNLKKLKIANREAVEALDKRMDEFRKGLEGNKKESPADGPSKEDIEMK